MLKIKGNNTEVPVTPIVVTQNSDKKIFRSNITNSKESFKGTKKIKRPKPIRVYVEMMSNSEALNKAIVENMHFRMVGQLQVSKFDQCHLVFCNSQSLEETLLKLQQH